MKNQKKIEIREICLWVGIGLLVVAAVVLIGWQWRVHTAQKQANAFVQTISTLIPPPQSAVLEERRDNTMPVLSVEGTDFVGILEMPRYGASHPVCAQWGSVSKYPCWFSGSIYDRTLQIGLTSQKGQYDFYGEISVGDAVFFTDMEGNRYAYTVANICYEKHADQTALCREESALTLFVKNVLGMEYIVISCEALQ